MTKLNLKFEPYTLQLKNTFTISSYSRTTTPVVLIRIFFETLCGFGEASLPQYLGETQESVCRFLSRVDLSGFKDPEDLPRILDYVDSIEPNNNAAKAAIDIALHDLLGKFKSQPCYKLFGIDKNKIPPTSYTIGIDSPEKLKAKILSVEGQFKFLKIKLGTDRDQDIIDTIRSVTSLPLYVDVNQGWKNKEHALDMIHYLAEQKTLIIEQPLPVVAIDDTAWLSARSPLPIIADEAVKRLPDIKNAVGVYSGINIKLMKSTGIREALKMIDAAKESGMKIMLGCMTETSCAISAATQLAGKVDYCDLDGALLITNDPFSGLTLKDGVVLPSDRPGIGVDHK